MFNINNQSSTLTTTIIILNYILILLLLILIIKRINTLDKTISSNNSKLKLFLSNKKILYPFILFLNLIFINITLNIFNNFDIQYISYLFNLTGKKNNQDIQETMLNIPNHKINYIKTIKIAEKGQGLWIAHRKKYRQRSYPNY